MDDVHVSNLNFFLDYKNANEHDCWYCMGVHLKKVLHVLINSRSLNTTHYILIVNVH